MYYVGGRVVVQPVSGQHDDVTFDLKKKILEKNGGYDSYKKLSKKANISHQNMFYYFVWARAHLRRHNSFLLKNSWPHFPSCKKKDGRHAWNSAPPETKEPYLVLGNTVHTTGCWNKTKKEPTCCFLGWRVFQRNCNRHYRASMEETHFQLKFSTSISLKYFWYIIITSFRQKCSFRPVWTEWRPYCWAAGSRFIYLSESITRKINRILFRKKT